jgi:hypothetical protein
MNCREHSCVVAVVAGGRLQHRAGHHYSQSTPAKCIQLLAGTD